MSRRDGYLTVWGVTYCAFAMLSALEPGPVWPMWVITFGFAGAVSMVSAVVTHRRFQAIAFGGLTGAAAIRATWHLTLIFSGELSFGTGIVPVVLWAAVAAGQMVVAGWPDQRGLDVE